MKTIDQQLQELESKFSEIIVTDDDLNAWRRHRVTKRFFLEMQHATLIALRPFDYLGPTDDMGNTAMRTNFSKGMAEAFELMMDWEPEQEGE